ncbi:MAG: HAD-IA family hydrolase [Bacteriovoracaceae bacterium]|jgi:HAD superfamily hydrolase (TIGR01549 family)|nr:HAD-IA family hydrolase [Bacteriovoracaceae bacterium]
MFKIKNVKAFIFDLDGTLIDSNSHVLKTFQYAVEPFDITLEEEDLEKIRSRTTETLFDGYISSKLDQKIAIDRLVDFNKNQGHLIKSIVGSIELVGILKKWGYPISIWTGRDTPSATSILQNLELLPFFDHVVGNCLVKNNKPSPDGLFYLAEKYQMNPESFVVIGDHDHDLQGAQSAGSQGVLVDQKRSLGDIHEFIVEYITIGGRLNTAQSSI